MKVARGDVSARGSARGAESARIGAAARRTVAALGVAALLLAAAPRALVAQSITRAELDALVQPAVDADWCRALVVGVVDGEQRLVAGYGTLASDDPRAPDGDTLFEIGSVSKVFTGILLGEAVTRGEVALDDPISSLLPEGVELGDRWPVPTLHDLSSHHSGLPRMPPDFDLSDVAAAWTAYDEARLMRLMGRPVPRVPPGSYAYSNLATGLLGTLLGRAADSDYATLVRERIAAPLGMHDTHVLLDDAARPRLAPAHDMELKPASPWDMAALAGCGGIRSSVNDMLRFAAWAAGVGEAHDSATLDEALRRSLLPSRDAGRAFRIGLGWHVNVGAGVWWHNGQTEGYHAMLEVLPDDGRAVIVLANDAGPLAEQVAESVMGRLLGEPLRPLDVPAGEAPNADELASLAGRYGNLMLGVMDVRADGERLFARLGEQPEFRLWPDGPRRFRYRAVDAVLEFGHAADADTDSDPAADADARDDEPARAVDELRLYQNGARLVFPREPSAPAGDDEPAASDG